MIRNVIIRIRKANMRLFLKLKRLTIKERRFTCAFFFAFSRVLTVFFSNKSRRKADYFWKLKISFVSSKSKKILYVVLPHKNSKPIEVKNQ